MDFFFLISEELKRKDIQKNVVYYQKYALKYKLPSYERNSIYDSTEKSVCWVI